jgi:hypothetical protein
MAKSIIAKHVIIFSILWAIICQVIVSYVVRYNVGFKYNELILGIPNDAVSFVSASAGFSILFVPGLIYILTRK